MGVTQISFAVTSLFGRFGSVCWPAAGNTAKPRAKPKTRPVPRNAVGPKGILSFAIRSASFGSAGVPPASLREHGPVRIPLFGRIRGLRHQERLLRRL